MNWRRPRLHAAPEEGMLAPSVWLDLPGRRIRRHVLRIPPEKNPAGLLIEIRLTK